MINVNGKCMQLLGIIGCTLWMMTACQKAPQRQAMKANYVTMKVKTDSLTLSTRYSATIRGCQDIEIYPQVGGTLQRLLVTEGQRVKKGQTLFIIDQVPYQAALNTAKANLESAQASLATAELTYQSTKRLFEQKVVSDFDLQKAQNTLLSAKAAVSQCKAQVTNAQNSLSYTTVKSPADGVVGTLPYRQGALVGSSMPQPLTTVSDNNTMYVYFSLPESQLLSMAREYGTPEEAVAHMPEVGLQLVDGSMYDLKGKVETISGVIDRNTGSVSLRAVFDNPKHMLFSGSTGNIVVPVEYKDQIIIPQVATVQKQDKYFVFGIDKDGNAKSIAIKIAPNNNGKEYIVTEGLKVGEEIIATGAGMIHEGQKIR
ncbi:MAG: efflux RND transporter periplasmic adaptor subunit [Paraprevotella sp.]|nr:efflux RND transporter periplasmic adaptor subunit [Paraprevotella sp.]